MKNKNFELEFYTYLLQYGTLYKILSHNFDDNIESGWWSFDFWDITPYFRYGYCFAVPHSFPFKKVGKYEYTLTDKDAKILTESEAIEFIQAEKIKMGLVPTFTVGERIAGFGMNNILIMYVDKKDTTNTIFDTILLFNGTETKEVILNTENMLKISSQKMWNISKDKLNAYILKGLKKEISTRV